MRVIGIRFSFYDLLVELTTYDLSNSLNILFDLLVFFATRYYIYFRARLNLNTCRTTSHY